MVLVQLSGEEHWLDEMAPFIDGPWDYSVSMPAELAARVRGRLVEVLRASAAGTPPHRPSRALLQRMMSVCVGTPVADEYVDLALEEMGLAGAAAAPLVRAPAEPRSGRALRVAVIGAGMSGLCTAIKLQQAGFDFVVFEKNPTVGGTWLENRYPGCGVDTPNHFYSYSFEPNHHWSEFYSKRDELQAYFENCADRYDLRRRIRFGTEVEQARYDSARSIWTLVACDRAGLRSQAEFDAVVCAVGQLNRPRMPEIAGMPDFRGPLVHSATWDPAEHPAKGRRVALVGTGASAIQIAPAIAAEVAHLSIFQRSPPWIVHNPNYHRRVGSGMRWVLEHVPYYGSWYRFQLFWGFADGLHPALQIDPEWPHPERSLNATNERHRRSILRHVERELGDRPDLLAKATPDYPPYGKRILIDTHWYRTLKRPNVELVTERIERIEPDAVVTADGRRHEAEMIVMATGFYAGRMLWPMDIVGRDGRRLAAEWGEDDPRAYLGITVPGYPNLFILYGPNTNLGHGGSAIFHAECQVRYVLQALQALATDGIESLECRQDVHDAYNERVDEAHRHMVWSHPGVDNWYRNRKGRVFANSPWRLVDYWRMTRKLDLEDFVVRRR
jgi:4-hydroxyacetophenone monooxygenase